MESGSNMQDVDYKTNLIRRSGDRVKSSQFPRSFIQGATNITIKVHGPVLQGLGTDKKTLQQEIKKSNR
jgi:hypothetical protein